MSGFMGRWPRLDLSLKNIRGHFSQWLLAFLVLALAGVILGRAWLSDDAYITFRVIDNFFHGYGLTWNVGERVQVYTHPLWMMLVGLVYPLTHEFYFTPIILGLVVTLIAVILLVRYLAVSPISACLVVLILLLSKSFSDYATSGLENPLSHLCVVVFYIILLRGKPGLKWFGWLALITALGMNTRMDLSLVFLPGLTYAFYKVRSWRAVGVGLLGMLPFLLWELFSLVYYGFLFPNTAYAKLNTYLSQGDLFEQGINYVYMLIRYDPVTACAMVAGLLLVWFAGDRRRALPVIGGLLYLFYVIKIGGDFMNGRFFTVPLVCALIGLAVIDLHALRKVTLAAVFGIFLLVGLVVPPETTFNFTHPDMRYKAGIMNERGYYLPGIGLIYREAGQVYPNMALVASGLELKESRQPVSTQEAVGFVGMYAGPDVYMLDVLAVTNPLLARLPPKTGALWRPGHFERAVPEGYIETLTQHRNLIKDPNLKQYYDRLSLIIQGPIFDPSRIQAIVEMNLGMDQKYLRH